MVLKDVYDFYKRMEDEHVILSFKGVFTSELLTSILHIMDIKMSDLGIVRKKKKRVFHVLVECLQNLYHHIEEVNENQEETLLEKAALIIVKHDGDRIVIRTGNYIHNQGIEEFTERLAEINTLAPEDLREEYQKKLLNNELSEKGTAGLGLIDIARKSKNKLGYQFIEIDDRTSFFCLSVVIE